MDFSLFSGLYYREDSGKFSPYPLSISTKVEDYIPVINCFYHPYNKLSQFIPYRVFSFDSQNDLACCGGLLYSCSTEVPGLESQKLSAGQTLNDAGNDACSFALGAYNQGKGISLECTSSGFDPPMIDDFGSLCTG